MYGDVTGSLLRPPSVPPWPEGEAAAMFFSHGSSPPLWGQTDGRLISPLDPSANEQTARGESPAPPPSGSTSADPSDCDDTFITETKLTKCWASPPRYSDIFLIVCTVLVSFKKANTKARGLNPSVDIKDRSLVGQAHECASRNGTSPAEPTGRTENSSPGP
ncbi:hypothetical protein AAFF_G00304420 [Aldrovandia affinis]|uniref:Uncharacterized protein n=1 Tax=Aldrovandia affinis TaxID=143900 RepID=A0AAD7WR00_9TELE|nr:hypothetical protein AAFF_G00304420 [Aldrovandia affinis]